MKHQFYVYLFAAGLLAGACTSSKDSDTKDQVNDISQESSSINKSTTTDNTPFTKELSLQGITFSIAATNQMPTNSVALETEGLEIGNDSQTIEIAGELINAETEDMNSDGSPEVILFFNSYDSIPEQFAIGFSVNNLKSLSRITIPQMTEEQKKGYQGGLEMAVVETKLIRRFPLYEQRGNNWVKTDKMRQLQYVLKEGEASRQFVLDQVVEF